MKQVALILFFLISHHVVQSQIVNLEIPAAPATIKAKKVVEVATLQTKETLEVEVRNSYDTTVSIYNSRGEVVDKQKIASLIASFDLTKLRKGVYYLKFKVAREILKINFLVD